MPRIIEKNDVDLSRLFKWAKEVPLEDSYAGTKTSLWMRIVGDSELGQAKTYSYRQAAKLRNALKQDGSDERLAFIAELEDYDETEMLINTIILLEVPDIYQEAIKNINVPEPKEPKSDAQQEVLEKYQQEVDAYPTKFDLELQKELRKLTKKEEKILKKKPKDELHKLYERGIINRLCTEELQNSYYDMCVYLGSYRDSDYKRRAFTSFDEYDNSHPTLKVYLRSEYQSLEIGADLLKKLPEATV